MNRRKSVFVEGKNCWQAAAASRLAFIIDAEAYFDNFRAALKKAKHSIFILGWDFDSRLLLKRDNSSSALPEKLGEFLNAVVSRQKDLHAYILSWDFAMIFAFEREFAPLFQQDWRTHPRIRFVLDGNHPVGASHHQKIVLVDEQLGFTGGLDLTARRWDTPEHIEDDPRRVDPWGAPYGPFHDVQAAVEGEAVRRLGEVFRERWKRATGQIIPVIGPSDGNPWPDNLKADLSNVPVGISRTEPQWEGRPEVREVEALFYDMIAAARRTIYIENQYITADRIGEALGKRLQEVNGPEVVIVAPRKCPGWLEQNTMGVYRAQLFLRLRKQDRYGRLRIYRPATKDLEIHSKVMIIDDEIARVGSANLSNRSMGLDTECDIAVEAGGNPGISEAIAAFKYRLVGEHLGASPGEVAATRQKEGSLGAAVEKIRKQTGALEPLEDESAEGVLCDRDVCDPERPMEAQQLINRMLPDIPEVKRGGLVRLTALLASLGAIAAAWHWTPLHEWVRPDMVLNHIRLFENSPVAPIIMMAVFGVGGLLIPITVLIIATVLVFDPAHGFFYSLLGCIVSASVSYKLGETLGRNTVRRFAGERVNRVSRQISRHGFLAITFLRIVALAPFTMINLIAGASHISFRDFILGTLTGMLPGIMALTIFGNRMIAAIRHPDPKSLIFLAVLVTLFLATSFWVGKRITASKYARGTGD